MSDSLSDTFAASDFPSLVADEISIREDLANFEPNSAQLSRIESVSVMLVKDRSRAVVTNKFPFLASPVVQGNQILT